ncbi:MAG TPA: glycoside hydrolase family 25 protein [Allosphingosinicella sp.]
MIDVSQANDLAAVLKNARRRNIELVVARATVGIGDPDTAFDKNLALLRASKGMMMGAYHALYPTHPGAEQAAEFLRRVKRSCRAGDTILLAVDWERASLHHKTIAPAGGAILADFVRAIVTATGQPPLVYTDPDVIAADRAAAGQVASAPLWLSTYYTKLSLFRKCQNEKKSGISICKNFIRGLLFPDDADFAPWTDWTFWQFTEASKEDPAYLRRRVTNDLPVDVSFFGGSREDFHQFFDQHAVRCEAINVAD